MRFTSPLFLLLLLLLPVITWMGWPSKGPARRREFASLGLRIVIILCLILSLAGMEIVRSGEELAVVFLVDVSDSMAPQAVAAEMDYLRSALDAMGPDDQAAIVLFGADALVERPMSVSNELGVIASVPITTQTDLAEAIRLGLALFPSGSARRMVILSDGAQTSGDALAAAEFAAASGVQIDVVPFLNQVDTEALVTEVDVPTRLRQDENFDLNISVQASDPIQAVVRVLSGNEILYEQPHDLRRGLQTLSIPLTAGEPGFVSYQVQIVPEQDVFYQNNRLDTFSQIEGPPRILMVAPAEGESLPGGGTRPDEYSALLQVLQAAGFSVELITSSFLPPDLPTLAQYDSVVLVDVPARSLSTSQMQSIQSYVRDLGGGLVAVGGPTSFGVGGYYGTPLEAALPVDMQIKDEKRRPSLAIVFIIDHSGSMSEASGGVEKLELAKEAAARSVELLFPTDRVGVIAFDDVASWPVPITDLSNPDAIRNAIGSIQIGGGTDIMAGLQAMAKALPDDPARVKHVILLTDGGADPTGIPELVERLYAENGITLSTVAVGNDAAPFLEDLAVLGGGRYHFTNDAASIPTIFTEETTLATRAYIVEESFFPKLVNSSPILAGIDSVPQLYGYVASSPKDLAQVILESDKGDPILAAWQYGLGRSVSFTSDATGRWGKDWVQSEIFPTFWTQAVRYTIGSALDTPLEMSVTSEGEQANLILDAFTHDGGFLNGYQVNANVIAPNGEIQSVSLQQIAPGRYEGQFNPTEQGIYLIRLNGQSTDGNNGGGFSETTGWALSYSPEYRRIEPDPDLLLRLSAITGGRVASPNPADVFSHDLKSSRASRPIWQWLILLAAILFPFDIAVRRLIITRQDMARLREWLIRRLGLRKRFELEAAQRSERIEALFQAKGRVRDGTGPPSQSSAPVEVLTPAEEAEPQIEEPEIPEKNFEPEVSAPQEPAIPLTKTLLERKKSQRKKRV
jgi:Mg-chelatase subunit ChlD